MNRPGWESREGPESGVDNGERNTPVSARGHLSVHQFGGKFAPMQDGKEMGTPGRYSTAYRAQVVAEKLDG